MQIRGLKCLVKDSICYRDDDLAVESGREMRCRQCRYMWGVNEMQAV